MDTVRSTLQPITRALPLPIFRFGVEQLGSDCYKSLVLDIDLHATDCIKLATSKALGIVIIAGSAVVKIPQILKLLNSQSASGVSFLSNFLETAAFVVTLAYNVRNANPFSTYGEIALVTAQNIVICLLVLRYRSQTAAAGAMLGGLLTAGWALQNEAVVNQKMLAYAQIGAGIVGTGSKLPQILAIWQQGGTGQLSAFAVFNYLIGSASRIFTTIQEVDDKMILYGFLAGFVLNAVLAAQMVYYWRSPATASHAAEMGKEPEKLAMGSTTGASLGKSKGPSTRRRG